MKCAGCDQSLLDLPAVHRFKSTDGRWSCRWCMIDDGYAFLGDGAIPRPSTPPSDDDWQRVWRYEQLCAIEDQRSRAACR